MTPDSNMRLAILFMVFVALSARTTDAACCDDVCGVGAVCTGQCMLGKANAMEWMWTLQYSVGLVCLHYPGLDPRVCLGYPVFLNGDEIPGSSLLTGPLNLRAQSLVTGSSRRIR